MNTAFLLLFLLLQIADIWTTNKALRLGKRELNPFLSWLFQRFDPVGVMVIVKVIAVWLLWYANLLALTLAACALYVWVVMNNWNVIKDK